MPYVAQTLLTSRHKDMIDERWQILQTELLLTEVPIRSILRAESQVVLRIPITSVVAKPHIIAFVGQDERRRQISIIRRPKVHVTL